jgi:hypothetical protein
VRARRLVRNVVIGLALFAAIGTTILTRAATAAQVSDDGPLAAVSAVAAGLTSICCVLVGALIEGRRGTVREALSTTTSAVWIRGNRP